MSKNRCPAHSLGRAEVISGRARVGPCPRVRSAVTGTFEHCEADPAPYGARAVAQSTWRDARPTPYTKVRCRQCLGERRFGTQMSPPSNGFMVEASAERPASWIKRRFYHPMVLGQLPSAQLSTCRPLIRAQKLRSIPPTGTPSPSRRDAPRAPFRSLCRPWVSGCRSSEYTSTTRYHMVWEMTVSSSAGRKMVAYCLFYPF